MNKTEQAQQLRLAAELIETGHPFAFQDGGEWVMAITITPDHAICERREIRPILATPPDGRPLHNPDNLTVEQVGLGYRLALIDEKTNENEALQEFWNKGEWMTSGRVYSDMFGESPNHRITYRLPISVPWPEAKPDPYAELKAAHAAGKVIQEDFIGTWHDVTARDPNWSLAPWLLRIKPELPPFQLPIPPPGMKWHREDGWKEGDLPQGYRPLVEGERRTREDEWTYDDGEGWRLVAQYGPEGGSVVKSSSKHRTTRPLIFTHEGNEWTYHKPGDPMPCDGDMLVCLYRLGAEEDCDVSNKGKNWFWKDETIIGWRYAETTKTVPLGPEDVSLFCAIQCASIMANVLRVCSKGVWLTGESGRIYLVDWHELWDCWQINRSIPITGKWDANAWEPCSKEVPA